MPDAYKALQGGWVAGAKGGRGIHRRDPRKRAWQGCAGLVGHGRRFGFHYKCDGKALGGFNPVPASSDMAVRSVYGGKVGDVAVEDASVCR